jgi:hypothetical protein
MGRTADVPGSPGPLASITERRAAAALATDSVATAASGSGPASCARPADGPGCSKPADPAVAKSAAVGSASRKRRVRLNRDTLIGRHASAAAAARHVGDAAFGDAALGGVLDRKLP